MAIFLFNRDKEDDSPVVEHFIARKADLLFAPEWKSTTPAEVEWQEDTQGYLHTVQQPNQSCKNPESSKDNSFISSLLQYTTALYF